MELDENLFENKKGRLVESSDRVKSILEPYVKDDRIKLPKDFRAPRGFNFKSSVGNYSGDTNGTVSYMGTEYVWAVVNGKLRVMTSSQAGDNWSETIYKENLEEAKGVVGTQQGEVRGPYKKREKKVNFDTIYDGLINRGYNPHPSMSTNRDALEVARFKEENLQKAKAFLDSLGIKYEVKYGGYPKKFYLSFDLPEYAMTESYNKFKTRQQKLSEDVNTDAVAKAEEFGKQAYANKKLRVPALDDNLGKFLQNCGFKPGTGDSIPAITAWLKGWDSANLATSETLKEDTQYLGDDAQKAVKRILDIASGINNQKNYPLTDGELDTLIKDLTELRDAINSKKDFKKDPDLKEDIESTELVSDTIEEPVKENNGLATVVNSLIQDEWQAIQGYKDAIVNFESEGRTELAQILQDILNEENIHVGQLETLLTKIDPSADKIADGEAEAEQLVATNVMVTESLDDTNHKTFEKYLSDLGFKNVENDKLCRKYQLEGNKHWINVTMQNSGKVMVTLDYSDWTFNDNQLNDALNYIKTNIKHLEDGKFEEK